jgi:hypothetical protein
MAILNYTTGIEVSKTMGEITGMLVKAGARQILTNFDNDGRPIGLAFLTETPMGPRHFVLPVNADKVHKVLEKQVREAKFKTPEHADRVAWRIMKDWVEAQLAIIQTEMVTLDQVMLPYMRDDKGRTVYDLYLTQQLALEAPKK